MAKEHKDFSCPACGAEFDTREQLEKHGKEAHQRTGQTGGSSPQRPNVETERPGETF